MLDGSSARRKKVFSKVICLAVKTCLEHRLINIYFVYIGCVDDFWTYRWVHVVDGTSEQPFIIELFSTSQPDIFEKIYPSTYSINLCLM